MEYNEIHISEIEGGLNFTVIFHEKKVTYEYLLKGKPKKAKVYPLSELKTYLKKGIVEKLDFRIITGESDLHLSSSMMQKISKELNSFIKKLEDQFETLPALDQHIIDYIDQLASVQKRSRLLGELPDKVVISEHTVREFLSRDIDVQAVVVPLGLKSDLTVLKKLSKKYHLILSIPDSLFEDEMKEMYLLIKDALQQGFNNFEANSYSAMEILSTLNCKKFIGPFLPVLNQLAAEFYYERGYQSLYASCEAELSTLKALSAFTAGQLEIVVFARLELFKSSVQDKRMKPGDILTDKFQQSVELFQDIRQNLFVSKDVFSLIGKKFTQEDISFNSLTADLRYFREPGRILQDLKKGKIDLKKTKSFNFYGKLQ